MSIYLCSVCNKFHETKAEMKNCKHTKEVEKVEETVEEIKEINIDELILNLDSLKAPDLKILANHFNFDYVNKEETVDKIKSILSENLEDSKSE